MSRVYFFPLGQQQAANFIKKIYEPGLLLFMDELFQVGIVTNGKGLTLMEGGTPTHTAIVKSKWCEAHQIHKLVWPPNSPGLNSFKNLWFKMKLVVTNLFNPKTIAELTKAIC
ncbi:hypothetical protein O181_049793 [Austropuccinia psidii MF-1]|uniref:Tc1-like transposase DDE domain-containing protein n=1 Tax=Austropuccinia psidii MF-1 TaxID=1389203 RepID=A0A9Q3DY69_9BASI|nr:hypothetical protein [Austropuccinia psidii MF-1]